VHVQHEPTSRSYEVVHSIR